MQPVPAETPGQIRVFAGIQELLVTEKATVIEFRDRFGDLMALFCRHFSDDMWIFVTKADEDWESHLVRLGYLHTGLTTEQLAKTVLGRG